MPKHDPKPPTQPNSVSKSNNPRPYIKHPRATQKPRTTTARPWDVDTLCAAYDWPTGLTGGGVIAIIELGGGWRPADLQQFCDATKIPLPRVTDVALGAMKNNPGADPDGDGEVALDIQVAAAAYSVATGKPADIRVYWVDDIAQGVRAAMADECDVCSISWGADEAHWGRAAALEMEAAAAAATSAGMVVFAAAGDNDSSDGGPTPANVDLPAGCPHVIACGGTRKTPTAEMVWNGTPGDPSGEGTGGGFSTLFEPPPAWQAGAPRGPGRMVPDVAANADPETGYNIVVNGVVSPTGGTSAVAPLYAGLFAAFGRKLGWVGPELWHNQVCFNDITLGDNGLFRARLGPDPCTGLGSPIGTKLAAVVTRPDARHARLVRSLREENARLKEALAAV